MNICENSCILHDPPSQSMLGAHHHEEVREVKELRGAVANFHPEMQPRSIPELWTCHEVKPCLLAGGVSW